MCSTKRGLQIRGRLRSTENVGKKSLLLSPLIAIANDKYLYVPRGKKDEEVEKASSAKAGKEGRVDGRGSRTRQSSPLPPLFLSCFFFLHSDADSRIEEWEFRETFHERLCLRVFRGSPPRQ